MGFVGKHSCYSFTLASIRQNAPREPGVYALSNANGWIYVGFANDMQAALWKHLGEQGTALRDARPTGFTFEACDAQSQPDRAQRLISDLSPSCNPSSPGRL